jgi:hypothetical protein
VRLRARLLTQMPVPDILGVTTGAPVQVCSRQRTHPVSSLAIGMHRCATSTPFTLCGRCLAPCNCCDTFLCALPWRTRRLSARSGPPAAGLSFFDRQTLPKRTDLLWRYTRTGSASKLAAPPTSKILLDATAGYLSNSLSAPRISQLVPHARFVVLLRVCTSLHFASLRFAPASQRLLL